MPVRQSSNDHNHLIFLIYFVGVLFTLAMTSCADQPVIYTPPPPPPPIPTFTNLTGWQGQAGAVNVTAQLGYEIPVVGGPTGNCSALDHSWKGNARIGSGLLPPGIYLDEHMSVRGVPSDTGHWHAILELSNIQCGGYVFQGMRQEILFHISGPDGFVPPIVHQ